MQPETKKIGEMLLDAGLIDPSQLQEALRQQRIAGGRMGSNLVALGFISEDLLMDFLAQKTGVPRVDPKNLDVPLNVLQKIPKRLADQLSVLPLSIKEPKSLVLAMSDPSDLNAIDSARFASGMQIEPVVASHSALRQAIADQYRKLVEPPGRTLEIGQATSFEDGLPVNFDPKALNLEIRSTHPPTSSKDHYGRDPFFDSPKEEPPSPFNFFNPETGPDPGSDVPTSPGMMSPAPMIIHSRSTNLPQSRSLDSYGTRTLLLGLIKMLQRRGILGDEELQRYIANLLEAGDLEDSDKTRP